MILDKICDIAVLGSRYIPFEQVKERSSIISAVFCKTRLRGKNKSFKTLHPLRLCGERFSLSTRSDYVL